MKRIELCLMVWNELEGCKKDVPNLPLIFDRVYAIDGGSKDGTTEFLESMGIKVIPQTKVSYNGAYIEAINEFRGDGIVFFHPKGTINVDSLITMKLLIEDGFDFVLASRLSKGAVNEEDVKILKFRKWFVRALALISKVIWGLTKKGYLDDPLHGYRAASSKFLESLKLNENDITADLEMIRHAYITDLSFTSFPVIENSRISGNTHFPAFSTGKRILRYLFGNK